MFRIFGWMFDGGLGSSITRTGCDSLIRLTGESPTECRNEMESNRQEQHVLVSSDDG